MYIFCIYFLVFNYVYLNILSFQGLFYEDQIPDGMFHIGDSVFVYASTFRGSTSAHIRRYKKSGSKMFPTKEGVTMRPNRIECIMGLQKVPATEGELKSISNDDLRIESADFVNFTFTRVNNENFSIITISCDQWSRMIAQYQDISTAVADAFYGNIDFFAVCKNQFYCALKAH